MNKIIALLVLAGAMFFQAGCSKKPSAPERPTPADAPQTQAQPPRANALIAANAAILAQSQPTEPAQDAQVNVTLDNDDGHWSKISSTGISEINGSTEDATNDAFNSARVAAVQQISEFINKKINTQQFTTIISSAIKQNAGYNDTKTKKIVQLLKDSIALSSRSILYALSANHPVMGVALENKHVDSVKNRRTASVTVIVDYTLLRMPEADQDIPGAIDEPASARSIGSSPSLQKKENWWQVDISPFYGKHDGIVRDDTKSVCTMTSFTPEQFGRNSGLKYKTIDMPKVNIVMVILNMDDDPGPNGKIGTFAFAKSEDACHKMFDELAGYSHKDTNHSEIATPTTLAADPDSSRIADPSKHISVGPSFNCANASTRVEIMICGNTELSALDRKMVAEYKNTIELASPNDAAKIKSEGFRWRTAIRDKCDSVECLRAAYTTRINGLVQGSQTSEVASVQRQVAVDHQSALAAAKAETKVAATDRQEFLKLVPPPNTAPFGYIYGPFRATTYLYHQKCPADNAADWSFGRIVIDETNLQDVGYSCWRKYKDDQTKYPGYSIEICDLGSVRWGLRQYDFKKAKLQCQFDDANKVLKFVPTPKADF